MNAVPAMRPSGHRRVGAGAGDTEAAADAAAAARAVFVVAAAAADGIVAGDTVVAMGAGGAPPVARTGCEGDEACIVAP